MLDAVMAGFVILGTNQLVTVYVTEAMGYSHVELGRMELVGFVGMLAGLLIALYATTNPARDPEKVIPIGIVLMLTACCLLTGRSAGSGFDDFWPALLLKGWPSVFSTSPSRCTCCAACRGPISTRVLPGSTCSATSAPCWRSPSSRT